MTYLEWPVRKPILNIDLLQIINHCSLMTRTTISSVIFREWNEQEREREQTAAALAYEVVNMGWASLYMGHI